MCKEYQCGNDYHISAGIEKKTKQQSKEVLNWGEATFIWNRKLFRTSGAEPVTWRSACLGGQGHNEEERNLKELRINVPSQQTMLGC